MKNIKRIELFGMREAEKEQRKTYKEFEKRWWRQQQEKEKENKKTQRIIIKKMKLLVKRKKNLITQPVKIYLRKKHVALRRKARKEETAFKKMSPEEKRIALLNSLMTKINSTLKETGAIDKWDKNTFDEVKFLSCLGIDCEVEEEVKIIPPPVTYEKHESVNYKTSDGTWQNATIIDVSYDDNMIPYYTINLGNGREKSTESCRLRKAPVTKKKESCEQDISAMVSEAVKRERDMWVKWYTEGGKISLPSKDCDKIKAKWKKEKEENVKVSFAQKKLEAMKNDANQLILMRDKQIYALKQELFVLTQNPIWLR